MRGPESPQTIIPETEPDEETNVESVQKAMLEKLKELDAEGTNSTLGEKETLPDHLNPDKT